MRLRLLTALAVTVLVVGASAFVAAVRYGAAALQAGGGYEQSIPATGAPVWLGVDVRDASAVTVTLRGFTPRGAENLRVTGARVVRVDRTGFGMLPEPLDPRLQAALDASAPVDGFVLPPSGRTEYQLIVRVQRIEPGRRAVLRGGAVRYDALGFDQGVVDDGISCIRAPGRSGCSAPS